MKGKDQSRAVPVNVDGREAIGAVIGWHQEKFGKLVGRRALFISRQGGVR